MTFYLTIQTSFLQFWVYIFLKEKLYKKSGMLDEKLQLRFLLFFFLHVFVIKKKIIFYYYNFKRSYSWGQKDKNRIWLD